MWYLVDTGFSGPYFNMAYDESLLDCIYNRNTVFFRFFNFSPVSVSLGYHQKSGGWLSMLENKGVEWVRRRTGGRAILHSCDCTYSIVFHRKNPLIGGKIIESYRKISAAFKKAFVLMGIETDIKRRRFERGEKGRSRMCFSSVSLADLCWKDRKIIGNAQYRVGDVVLQEGTIMLKEPPGFSLNSSMATLEIAAGEEVKLGKAKDFIIKGFESTFGFSFQEFNANPLKSELLSKYSSEEWNLKGAF